MATGKVRLPLDSGNAGQYIGYEEQSIGGFALLMQRMCLTDKTLDQVAGIVAKAIQPAYAVGTQDMKDAGRVIFSAASVIAGVATVTTEALLTMIPTRDGTSTATVTTQVVTSGKRLRASTLVCGCISTAAAVLSGRVSLRYVPTGAVAANSPIICTCALSVPAALAQMGDWCVVPIPDEVDFSGNMQFGVTQLFSATTGLVWASIVGFEH